MNRHAECEAISRIHPVGLAYSLARNAMLRVFSAGTEPARGVFPAVVEVMKEVGIDISVQEPKGVDVFLGKVFFEKVIVVCAAAEEKCPTIFGSAPRLFWPFDDPAAAAGSKEDIMAVCRRVRDEIDNRICEWLREQGIPAQPLTI